jgi:TonB family protein
VEGRIILRSQDRVEGRIEGRIVKRVQSEDENEVIVIEEDSKRPRMIKRVEPVYPEAAIKEGIEGEIVLRVTTDKKGQVEKVEILNSIPALDDAAVEAVKQWIYEPYLVDGKPRRVAFKVKVIFRLK